MCPGFNRTTLTLVCLNALFIGIEADTNKAESFIQTDWYYHLINYSFFLYFVLEMWIRFMAFKNKRSCLMDNWFKFDALTVGVMIIDDVLMPVFVSGVLPWIQTLLGQSVTEYNTRKNPMRLVRLLRLVRIARLVHVWPELAMLFRSMSRAVSAVSASLVLVVLMTYVFGITLYMLVGNEAAFDAGFGNVRMCMWTLMISGLFLDNCGDVLSDLKDHDIDGQPWEEFGKFAAVVFLIYILLANITLMNMLIGILCEVVSNMQHKAKEDAAIDIVRRSLLLMLSELDGDEDGNISQAEFAALIEHPDAIEVLEHLEVDVDHLLKVQQHMLYAGGENLSIDTILGSILQCRGDRPTTQADLTDLMKHNRLAIQTAIETLQDRIMAAMQDLTDIESSELRETKKLEALEGKKAEASDVSGNSLLGSRPDKVKASAHLAWHSESSV